MANAKKSPLANYQLRHSIFDIGKKTVEKFADIISKAKSIVVSGPMGVYENKEFNYGTKKVFEAIANSKAFSLAGGGNTIAAIRRIRLEQENRLHQHRRRSTHRIPHGQKTARRSSVRNSRQNQKNLNFPSFLFFFIQIKNLSYEAVISAKFFTYCLKVFSFKVRFLLAFRRSFKVLNWDGTKTVFIPASLAPLMSSIGLSPM